MSKVINLFMFFLGVLVLVFGHSSAQILAGMSLVMTAAVLINQKKGSE